MALDYPNLRTEKPREQLEKAVDVTLFRHRIRGRVRSFEVDRQNIVHNAVYLQWLETGRIEYWRACGLPIDQQTFVTKYRFVVAHVEVDYLWAARFDEEYEVLTRTLFVKNSSFGMEQIIQLLDGTLLVVANVVLVHLNAATWKPQRISDALRKLIQEFEGEKVQFIESLKGEG